MENGTPQKRDDGKLFPQDEPPVVIEPLKPKRPSRTITAMESLLTGLEVALVTEINAVKEEILHRLGDVEASIEAVARQMARDRRASGEETPSADAG